MIFFLGLLSGCISTKRSRSRFLSICIFVISWFRIFTCRKGSWGFSYCKVSSMLIFTYLSSSWLFMSILLEATMLKFPVFCLCRSIRYRLHRGKCQFDLFSLFSLNCLCIWQTERLRFWVLEGGRWLNGITFCLVWLKCWSV